MTRRLRRGLSLLDVAITVSILLVITTMTAVSMRNAIRLNEAMKAQDMTLRGPLMKIRRELQLAFLTPDITAAERYQTVFVGRNEDPDRLWFATRGHQRKYRDSRESDQAEITLWAESMPRREGYPSDGYVLYHRESPRVDHEPDEGGVIHPMAYNVRSFDLRYLDPRTNEWREEWDTRTADMPNILPRAVELSMVVLTPDPKNRGEFIEKPFKTTIPLEFAQPMVQQAGGAGFGQ
jgi:type II secretory pathway component PulJ